MYWHWVSKNLNFNFNLALELSPVCLKDQVSSCYNGEIMHLELRTETHADITLQYTN
jgi:hypothetical protein